VTIFGCASFGSFNRMHYCCVVTLQQTANLCKRIAPAPQYRRYRLPGFSGESRSAAPGQARRLDLP
jgi:hypothetical protein